MQKMSKVGRSGRGSSPPPEQDSREEDWGPHEQPTRPVPSIPEGMLPEGTFAESVFPSSMPGAPPGGAGFPSEGPTLPRGPRDIVQRSQQATKPALRRQAPKPDGDVRPPSLSLDDEFEHPSQRVTAPPPREPAKALSTPARRDVVTDPAPPGSTDEDDDIFDRPTLDVVDESADLLGLGYAPARHHSPSGLELAVPVPSQIPTAPPPEEFELDLRNVGHVPSPGSLQVFMEEPASRELRVPPHGGRSVRPSERPSAGPSRPPNLPPAREMNDRFAMGDFSGALEKARYILTLDPLDREARTMATKCEEVLLDMYSSRIAGMHRTVRTVMGADQLRWLSLDHRAGFLLSLIDGHSSVDDLLDLCGMPRLEALRLICSLVDQRVVELS